MKVCSNCDFPKFGGAKIMPWDAQVFLGMAKGTSMSRRLANGVPARYVSKSSFGGSVDFDAGISCLVGFSYGHTPDAWHALRYSRSRSCWNRSLSSKSSDIKTAVMRPAMTPAGSCSASKRETVSVLLPLGRVGNPSTTAAKLERTMLASSDKK